MRLLLVGLILALPLQTFAARRGTPFLPEVDKRFDELENDYIDQSGIAVKYLKVTYEPAVDGGSSGSTIDTGVYLPAGAVVTNAYLYVNTAIEGVGGGIKGGSLAFQCAGTRDLMGYQDMETFPLKSYVSRGLGHAVAIGFGANALIAENQTPAIQGVGSSVATRCQIQAVIRGSSGDEALGSGKANLLLTYFISN